MNTPEKSDHFERPSLISRLTHKITNWVKGFGGKVSAVIESESGSVPGGAEEEKANQLRTEVALTLRCMEAISCLIDTIPGADGDEYYFAETNTEIDKVVFDEMIRLTLISPFQPRQKTALSTGVKLDGPTSLYGINMRGKQFWPSVLDGTKYCGSRNGIID